MEEKERRERSDGRLLFRLSVGAVAVGTDRLVAELRSWDAQAREAVRDARSGADHPTRQRLVGALIMAPGYLRGASRQAGRLYGRTAERVLAPLGARLLRTERGRRSKARLDALRARFEAEVATWETLGRLEERDGRALAEVGLATATESFLERLAQNPELRELIAEQSAGLTRSLLDEAREVGVVADGRVEAAIRRLLRRPPRTRPTGEPVPAGE
jgi:hypothetical protein